MCVEIIRNNSLVGGRARAKSNPGHWAHHALLHMAAECVNHSATRAGVLCSQNRDITMRLKVTSHKIHCRREFLHSCWVLTSSSFPFRNIHLHFGLHIVAVCIILQFFCNIVKMTTFWNLTNTLLQQSVQSEEDNSLFHANLYKYGTLN